MRNQFWSTTVPVCLAILAIGGWLATAGTLSPPAGPVAPTMKTLDELSAQIGAGSIKQVIRGVMTYAASGLEEQTQNFTPAIDPAKSVVVLSPCCSLDHSPSTAAMVGRDGACVMNLTPSQITIRVDSAGIRLIGAKVAYQIIEYN